MSFLPIPSTVCLDTQGHAHKVCINSQGVSDSMSGGCWAVYDTTLLIVKQIRGDSRCGWGILRVLRAKGGFATQDAALYSVVTNFDSWYYSLYYLDLVLAFCLGHACYSICNSSVITKLQVAPVSSSFIIAIPSPSLSLGPSPMLIRIQLHQRL